MTTATKTRKLASGAEIEVKLTREVNDDIQYWDGYELNKGRKIYERYDVTIKAYGQTFHGNGYLRTVKDSPQFHHVPEGVYARGCDIWLSKQTYDAIAAMKQELDEELPKSDEYLTLKAKEIREAKAAKEAEERNIARMEAEHKARQRHPGWCNKCHSYCYGDCSA